MKNGLGFGIHLHVYLSLGKRERPRCDPSAVSCQAIGITKPLLLQARTQPAHTCGGVQGLSGI